MLYCVHGYYGKYGSPKRQEKIEVTVYAANACLAEELVKNLFEDFPVKFDGFSVIQTIDENPIDTPEKYPELIGIDPRDGYIYGELFHRLVIRKYFK